MNIAASIRLSMFSLLGVAYTGVAQTVREPADHAGVIVFRDIRVFDGETVLSSATVIIQGRTIRAVAATVPPPEGATIIEGKGMTLLPGLIDAHVHNIDEPLLLRQAAAFGVTTALNMFTWDPKPDVERRKEQDAGLATNRADLFTAGIGVTATSGHGTQYGFAVPTLDGRKTHRRSSTRGSLRERTTSKSSSSRALRVERSPSSYRRSCGKLQRPPSPQRKSEASWR